MDQGIACTRSACLLCPRTAVEAIALPNFPDILRLGLSIAAGSSQKPESASNRAFLNGDGSDRTDVALVSQYSMRAAMLCSRGVAAARGQHGEKLTARKEVQAHID